MTFVHSLPFHISFSGKADVANGFAFYPSERGGADCTASFRGRKLIGRQCELGPALAVIPMVLDKERLVKADSAKDFSLFEWAKEEDAHTLPKLGLDRLASLAQFRHVMAQKLESL